MENMGAATRGKSFSLIDVARSQSGARSSFVSTARNDNERGRDLRLCLRGREFPLRYLLCDFDGDCGLASNFGAMIDSLCNGASSGEGVGALMNGLFLPERWLDRATPKLRREVNEAWRALTGLYARNPGAAIVLSLLYGPKNSTGPAWVRFGEFRPIAHMTATARALAERDTAKLRATRAAEIVRQMSYEAAVAPLVTHHDRVWATSIDELRAKARATKDALQREEIAFQIRMLKKRRMTLDPRASEQREIPSVEAVQARSTLFVEPYEVVNRLAETKGKNEHVEAIQREAEQLHIAACADYMTFWPSLRVVR